MIYDIIILVILFLKVSEVVRDHPDRGSHSSCVNLYLLRRFMGTPGTQEWEGQGAGVGAGGVTYDCCLHRQALVVGNGFLVASVG